MSYFRYLCLLTDGSIKHVFIIRVTWWGLITGRNKLSFANTSVQTRVLVGSMLLIFVGFVRLSCRMLTVSLD